MAQVGRAGVIDYGMQPKKGNPALYVVREVQLDVPLRALHLRTDRSQLQQPFPLRGDLRELSFDSLARPSSSRFAHIILSGTQWSEESPRASAYDPHRLAL
jgi:hypothetical protein